MPLAPAALAVLALSCSAVSPQGGGRPLTVLVDVADVSGSGDITTRCAEMAARIRPVIEDPHTRHLDLLALATGAAAGEPSVLVPWTEYAPAAGLYESPESIARQRAAWLLGVERTCVARLRSSDVSPVFEAVQRALEAIEARCGERTRERYRCARKLLAVQSDLRSTSGPFGAYLRSLARRRPKQAPVPVAPRLTLGDVELSLCGFSNTDAGDGLPAEVVLAAWREALGRPVVADPTCATDPIANGAKP
jgi:hypothetical protein